jgi:SAM-dependent methyltransferase
VDHRLAAVVAAKESRLMGHWPSHTIWRLYILVLLARRPATLFQRINQLPWYAQTLRQWSVALCPDHGGRILEVGCASGALSEHLAANGFAVTGVDASPAMIKLARKNRPLADYWLANANALPFEDNAFDTVICASLLNIVADRPRLISEMTRVCKPDGTVSTLAPLHGFNDRQLDELAGALAINGFSRAALTTWHKSAPKMRGREMEELLLGAGLEPILRHRYLQGMLFSVTAVKHEPASTRKTPPPPFPGSTRHRQ